MVISPSGMQLRFSSKCQLPLLAFDKLCVCMLSVMVLLNIIMMKVLYSY